MKNILYSLSACFIYMGCFFATTKSEIPSFNIMLQDSATIFNTKNIPKGKPSVLIFFSPDCEHCQKETADILQKMDSLKNIQFYFITIDPMERMKVFNGYYHLKKYPSITLGRDYTFYLPIHFKDISPPSSFVYDKHQRLRAVFKGEVTAGQLISLVNEM